MAGTETEKKLPQVREFADQVLSKAVEDGRIAPDDAGHGASTPTFSKGTVALDANGKPIIPKANVEAPPFEAGRIEVEPGTGPEPAPVEAPPVEAAPPAQVPEAAAAGAAAAEAAAQAIEEYEEFAFHDPDLDLDVPIRVLKKFASTAKRGYGSRASYDRSVSYLGNARSVLEPLISDGRIQRILPMLQAALENEEFGGHVTQVFERLKQGLPLVEQARLEAAVAGATAAAAPETFTPEGYTDPFSEVVDARMKPITTELAEMRAWRDQQAQAAEQTRQQQQQQQRQNAWINEQMVGAHHDLARMYPGKFDTTKGPNDPMWQQALKFAKDAGYEGVYGVRGGAVFGGQQIIALDHERLAATSSPAAEALAQADQQLQTAARREARASAAAVSGGGVATTTMPQAPPKPVPTGPDGKLKDRTAYMAEVEAWHRQYGRLKQ